MPYYKPLFISTRRLGVLLLFVALISSCKKQEKPEPVVPKPPQSAEKSISAFAFSKSKNPFLLEDLTGTIQGDTIYVSTFAGTPIDALVADFSYTGSRVTVNNKQQSTGVTVNDFGDKLKYIVAAADSSKKTYVVKFTDTGLPAVYISTNNVPIDSKDNYIDGMFKIVKDIGGEVLINAVTEIKGRGNSTWNFEKKPYRIKLDKKAALLGMPENKHWVLLANYADKSLIRNELAFELSRGSGLAYTPRSRFVEVVLNGQYMGNYQLVEQIKEGKDRVDIEEQKEGAGSLPAISGGYMLEIDGFAWGEPVFFVTSRSLPVTIKYPDDDVINDAQKNYIAGHFQKFEDALFADNFTDAQNGYRKYFDVNSYINYYIVNEVVGNSDMFWSTYLYKKKDDDKLYTGPVWDFDISFNNDERLGNAVNKLMYTDAHDPKLLINRMMQDPEFRKKIRSRWNELKTSVIDKLPALADQLAAKLAISQAKNFNRWNILSQKVYLENYVSGSYPKEVEYVKTYLINRINWLDTKFNGSSYQ